MARARLPGTKDPMYVVSTILCKPSRQAEVGRDDKSGQRCGHSGCAPLRFSLATALIQTTMATKLSSLAFRVFGPKVSRVSSLL